MSDAFLDRVSDTGELDKNYLTLRTFANYLNNGYNTSNIDAGSLDSSNKAANFTLYSGSYTNNSTYPLIVNGVGLNSNGGSAGSRTAYNVIFLINNTVMDEEVNLATSHNIYNYNKILYPGESISLVIKTGTISSGYSQTNQLYIGVRWYYNN